MLGHLYLLPFLFFLERLHLVDKFVASLLPALLRRLQLLNILLVLFQKADGDSLVQVNQVIPYLDNILIVTLPARAHRPVWVDAAAAPHVHHRRYLHLQILDQIAQIRLLPLVRAQLL